MPMHTEFALTLDFVLSIAIVIFSTGSGWFLLKRSEKDVHEIREDVKELKIDMFDVKKSLAVHSEKITNVNEKMLSFGNQIDKVLKLLTDRIPSISTTRK
jgi:Co/Zn/Cd efflux system component